VTKLVPFGAFVRVADGIEGLVHISELSTKHIELAEQVVVINQDVFVKVIDIDLDRRRISLSLKQALEEVNPDGTEFNPALYGMYAEYDDKGQYKYPDGFDAATGEWQPGHEEARAKWEKEYSAAHVRWEEHKKQVALANKLAASLPDVPAPAEASAAETHTSESSENQSVGTLADDESLSALRDKLTDNE
jgi:small subunit ribosomal protein S1